MTPRFHTLKIAEVRRETPEAVSLRFDLPPELRADYAFAPGQHLALRVTIDGQEVRRSYSICAGLDDGELRVAIRKVAGGRFSTWANDALKAGDAIDVMTPDGRFTVPIDAAQARHYVAFAAGSGITPILSLAKTLLRREPGSPAPCSRKNWKTSRTASCRASCSTTCSRARSRRCRCSTAASTPSACAPSSTC
jgi:ring-1,2-phenylacetyl-CoA epoxidase subunit PaaE